MDKTNETLLLTAVHGELTNVSASMTPAGLSYMYFVDSMNSYSGGETFTVCSVELPFRAGAHIIGVPAYARVRPQLDYSGYESVQLEGEYNKVFSLYDAKGEQMETRYVLDPAAMVFTLDFCSVYYWEIADDTLYFLSGSAVPGVELIDQFVMTIRPALEIASPRSTNAYKLPYTFTEGRNMTCPRCSEKLREGREWMEYPKGHGFLIRGSQIADERASQEAIPYMPSPEIAEDSQEITHCPYCSSRMVRTQYQNTAIIIDVCTKCPYRWIDGNEIETVLGTVT